MANWFPGHMKKSLNALDQKIKIVDLVIEVADARAINSSRNSDLNNHGRPHLLILNKADLVDPKGYQAIIEKLAHLGIKALLFDKNQKREVIINCINQLVQPARVKAEAKGQKFIPRALVVGIPNVGKSTLINLLKGKGGVKVENRPGVTRGYTFIKLKDLELLDSPGILPPRLDSDEHTYKLLAISAIKDDIIDWEEAAHFLLSYLSEHYPENLKERYQVDEFTLEAIGRARHLLKAENEVDLLRTAQMLVREIRSGNLGRIRYEE